MDNTRRAQIIRAHLEATSRTGGAPRPERIGVWLHELRDVPGAMLDACISQSREEHAGRAENGKAWGAITPDDVKRCWRRISKKDRQSVAEAPENRHCPLRCDRGRVLFDGPDQYEVCVRCSCPAGDWWAQFPTWGAMPNADDLQARGGVRPAGAGDHARNTQALDRRPCRCGGAQAGDQRVPREAGAAARAGLI